MNLIETCDKIFAQAIECYHTHDDVDFPMPVLYDSGSFEMLIFHKCYIDTVQWHLEDIIRDPNIDPIDALKIKRRIDASNQDRTDKVEYIDNFFLDKYKSIIPLESATLNTETLAWAVDRYSILALKIYHMNAEVIRPNVSEEHIFNCQTKLNVLLDQRNDLSTSIKQLIEDIEAGKKIIKTYKQMKMYNDPSLNPVLYVEK